MRPTRDVVGAVFHLACFAATWMGLIALVVLLAGVLWQAWGWLDWDFLAHFDSRRPAAAGVKAGLWGSLWLLLLTAIFSVPVGVGAAVYLEEYAKDSWLTRAIQINLANLAGVPSIVYGILGLTVFVRLAGLTAAGKANVVAGALTLSLLILPVVIVASQESLRSIPASLRHGAYALGATRWQAIRYQVLPSALPGIITGVILALSRAIGETAPLIILGVPAYLRATPGGIESFREAATNVAGLLHAPFSVFTAMPMLIFNWASHPKTEFQHVAAAAIVVLLAILLAMNATAIFVRHRFQKRIRW